VGFLETVNTTGKPNPYRIPNLALRKPTLS